MSVQIQSGVVKCASDLGKVLRNEARRVRHRVHDHAIAQPTHGTPHGDLHRTLCCLHDRAYINPGCTPDHVLYLNIPIPFRGITLVVQLRPQIELRR
jgi:hypothetical protein